MELTIRLPDDLGQQIRDLPDRDEFIAETLKTALKADKEQRTPSSRWAKLAQRISEDPIHLSGYSENLIQDARQVRDEFVLGDLKIE